VKQKFNNMLNIKEVKALLNLLDDPDEVVFQNVKNKLNSYGKEIIPILEDTWEISEDKKVQDRIEEIIHDIQFEKLYDDFNKWTEEGSNIYEGYVLVTKYLYPDLDINLIVDILNSIKHDIWLEINENLTALEKIRVLNHVFFDVYKFRAVIQDTNNPNLYYINSVLSSKKGNNLSLSLIYLVLAQQLKLPIYGINLPDHFVLAYLNDSSIRKFPELNEEVLFYINVQNKGSIFSEREINYYLKQMNLEPIQEYFLPCSNIIIIKILINELIKLYEGLEEPAKVKDLILLKNSLILKS